MKTFTNHKNFVPVLFVAITGALMNSGVTHGKDNNPARTFNAASLETTKNAQSLRNIFNASTGHNVSTFQYDTRPTGPSGMREWAYGKELLGLDINNREGTQGTVTTISVDTIGFEYDGRCPVLFTSPQATRVELDKSRARTVLRRANPDEMLLSVWDGLDERSYIVPVALNPSRPIILNDIEFAEKYPYSQTLNTTPPSNTLKDCNEIVNGYNSLLQGRLLLIKAGMQ